MIVNQSITARFTCRVQYAACLLAENVICAQRCDLQVMTVIPKKRKFSRPDDNVQEVMDYGQKYHCDSCQKDISHVVRVCCNVCKDFDLCVECFVRGTEVRDHKKSHAYRVMVIDRFQ